MKVLLPVFAGDESQPQLGGSWGLGGGCLGPDGESKVGENMADSPDSSLFVGSEGASQDSLCEAARNTWTPKRLSEKRHQPGDGGRKCVATGRGYQQQVSHDQRRPLGHHIRDLWREVSDGTRQRLSLNIWEKICFFFFVIGSAP